MSQVSIIRRLSRRPLHPSSRHSVVDLSAHRLLNSHPTLIPPLPARGTPSHLHPVVVVLCELCRVVLRSAESATLLKSVREGLMMMTLNRQEEYRFLKIVLILIRGLKLSLVVGRSTWREATRRKSGRVEEQGRNFASSRMKNRIDSKQYTQNYVRTAYHSTGYQEKGPD